MHPFSQPKLSSSFDILLILCLYLAPTLLQPATTAEGVATSPGTARSRRRRGSRFVTTVAKLAMWPETVTTPTSRSATPAVDSGTYRKVARKSSATGRHYG